MRTIVTRREIQTQSCGSNLRMRLERDDTETRGLRGLGKVEVLICIPKKGLRIKADRYKAQFLLGEIFSSFKTTHHFVASHLCMKSRSC
jgi:hypothetical protein